MNRLPSALILLVFLAGTVSCGPSRQSSRPDLLADASSADGQADTDRPSEDAVDPELVDLLTDTADPDVKSDILSQPDGTDGAGTDGTVEDSDDSVIPDGQADTEKDLITPDFSLKIVSPTDSETVSGSIYVAIEPVEITELKLDSIVVTINGSMVFEDTKIPTGFILNTRAYQDPVLTLEATGSVEDKSSTDKVKILRDNPDFHFKLVAPERFIYHNGEIIEVLIDVGKPGLTITADFGSLDSQFLPSTEIVQEIGGGKYTLLHEISLTNEQVDGSYTIPISAAKGEEILHYPHLALTLENTLSLPVRVEGGIFVPGTMPAADNSWVQPIGGLSGNEFIITGGTAKLSADFSGYAYPDEIIGILVGASGYGGYYQMPVEDSQGIEEMLLLMRTYVDPEVPPANLTFRVALRDVTGRISPYLETTLSVETVGSGDVQVSISWDTLTDVDLHVVEPSGEELYFSHKNSASGGELDLDSNPACSIDGINNENVYWPPSEAPPGLYTVRVDFYEDCYNCSGLCGANYTVSTHYCGLIELFEGSFAPGTDDGGSAGSGVEITTFSNENCASVIRGRIRYADMTFDDSGFSARTWRPARYVRVELHRSSDNVLLTTGSTDRFGHYEMQFTNSSSPGVYLVVSSATDFDDGVHPIAVMNHPKFKQLYTISSFSVDETEADIPTLDFDIPELVGAGAFNILDVLIDGYDRVRLMTGKDLGQLYAFWATGTDTTDTLYCSQYFYELGICSQLGAVSVQGKDTDRDEYDDMVILKEFFKFALEQVSLDDNPGGYHDGTRDDPRRAWTEGVTTFFAADVLGYHYFINSKPSGVYLLQNLETMLSPFAFGTASDTMDGPLSEYLVSAVLFDIADSDDNETFDALNDAGFALYDAIFNYFPSEYFVDRGFTGVDLVDFLDGWFCRGWNQNNSISAIVTDHRLFPYDFASQGECIH